MDPARRELDIAAFSESIESGIAVDLNDAFELRQMGGGSFGPTVGTVEVDGCRRVAKSGNWTGQPVSLKFAAAKSPRRQRESQEHVWMGMMEKEFSNQLT